MFNLWAFMLNKDTNYHELTMNFAVSESYPVTPQTVRKP